MKLGNNYNKITFLMNKQTTLRAYTEDEINIFFTLIQNTSMINIEPL